MSSKAIFFTLMAVSALALVIGTALLAIFFPVTDGSFDWRAFAVYLLIVGWFSFLGYGTYIGVVNLLNESELKEKTRLLRQCNANRSQKLE